MDNKLVKAMIMFLSGGIIYFYFEILVRGYSHISMFLLGGICFCIVGRIGTGILQKNKPLKIKMALIMLIASVVITSLELITGIIVNIHFNLSVWDYSKMDYNFKGQICLLYSVLWGLLGLPCAYFYGVIDRFVIGEVEESTLQEKLTRCKN